MIATISSCYERPIELHQAFNRPMLDIRCDAFQLFEHETFESASELE